MTASKGHIHFEHGPILYISTFSLGANMETWRIKRFFYQLDTPGTIYEERKANEDGTQKILKPDVKADGYRFEIISEVPFEKSLLKGIDQDLFYKYGRLFMETITGTDIKQSEIEEELKRIIMILNSEHGKKDLLFSSVSLLDGCFYINKT